MKKELWWAFVVVLAVVISVLCGGLWPPVEPPPKEPRTPIAEKLGHDVARGLIGGAVEKAGELIKP